MSVTFLDPVMVPWDDGSCCCETGTGTGSGILSCCVGDFPHELCVTFNTQADATCRDMRDLGNVLARIYWNNSTQQYYGEFQSNGLTWYFKLWCFCDHEGHCWWRTGLGLLTFSGTGTEIPPMPDDETGTGTGTGTGIDPEPWTGTGTGTWWEADLWSSQTPVTPDQPCIPFGFTTDPMRYDGVIPSCYETFTNPPHTFTATIQECPGEILVPCCEDTPLPVTLHLTILNADSSDVPECACWEGRTFPMNFVPANTPPYSFPGDVWIADFIAMCAGVGTIALVLQCNDGVWSLSVERDILGGPMFPDPLSCDPFHLVFDASSPVNPGGGLQIDLGAGHGACVLLLGVVTL